MVNIKMMVFISQFFFHGIILQVKYVMLKVDFVALTWPVKINAFSFSFIQYNNNNIIITFQELL